MRSHPPCRAGRGFSFPGGRTVAGLAVAVVAAATAPAIASHTSPAAAAAASDALAWLEGRQLPNGSLANDTGMTAELVLAIKAAGRDPNAWVPSPVTYLQQNVGAAIAEGPGRVGKVILAVKAAGRDPRGFGGRNLVMEIQGAEVAGLYDPFLAGQAFAMLGLRAAGAPAGDLAAAQVLRSQDALGGWSWTGLPVDSDTNSTALAVQALLSAGSTATSAAASTAVLRAIGYLHLQQSDDAGFAYQRVSAFCLGVCDSDPNSTAYVIQALAAARESFDGAGWQKAGRNPVQALIEMQGADGSFAGYGELGKILATVQAVPGLLGKSFLCIAVVAC